MRSPPYKLTPTVPTVRINTGWRANRLVCDNPTPNIILIRFGGDATPTLANADIVIPAASSRVWPIATGDVVATFLGTAAIAADVSSGLATDATVQLLDEREPDVAAQSLTFINLSLAQAVSGGPAASGTLGPFDLSTWGGLILTGHPDVSAWDQHGWAAYETSPDGVTWTRRVRLPLWPGMELSAQLPRYDRYARVPWQAYGAPWAAAPTFSLTARPTLAEILSVVPVLAGSAQEWPWGPLAGVGTTVQFYAPGDLVASIDWSVSNGSNAGTGTVSLGGQYGTVQPATQPAVSQIPLGATRCIHASMADPFPIASVLIARSAGSINGVWSAVPRVLLGPPDVTGQPGDPVTAPTVPGLLAAIGANTAGVPAALPVLGTIADVAGVLTHEGQLRQIVAQLAALLGYGALATEATLASALVQETLTAARLVPQAGGTPTSFNTGVAAAVVTNTGIDLPAGQRLYACFCGSNAAAGTGLFLGLGPPAGPFALRVIDGAAPGVALNMGHLTGINYGANTRIFVFSALAANVQYTLWTA